MLKKAIHSAETTTDLRATTESISRIQQFRPLESDWLGLDY